MPARRIAAITVLLLSSRAAAIESDAGLSPKPGDHVPITENFSTEELELIAGIGAYDLTLYLLQSDFVSGRQPLIGAPPGFDAALSQSMYLGPNHGSWLDGLPDSFGLYIAPLATFAFYGIDALTSGGLTGDANADHHLLALTEAYGIAMGFNQTVKLAVGRERPAYYFGESAMQPSDSEIDLSFFSGHATSSFTLAAFIHRDLSDWLLRNSLAGASDGERLWLGRIAPAVVLYGAATAVGVSRIIDQKHYLSDVVIGAGVGTLVGNLVYSLHFDSHGDPRRHISMQLVPVPGGLGLAGTF